MSSYYIPCIVKESAEGTVRVPIEDELFRRREIQCVGEITPEAAHSLMVQLRYLHMMDDTKEITIFVNCPGGSVQDGLAVIDVMSALRCPVKTVCMNIAASMGALIFASGNERCMLPHSRVMVHNPRIHGSVGGDALHLDAMTRDLMQIREVTASLLAERTGHTIEEVYEKTDCSTYFDAREALEWGLADRIIHEI